MRIIGIDPGKSGAIAVIEDWRLTDVYSFNGKTEEEIANYISHIDYPSIFFIEDVHSSPQQGVASAFTFGRGYGFLLGVLMGRNYSVKKVRPTEWQGALGCLSGGDKKIPFELAKKIYMFDRIKGAFNRSSADAVLIAHYGYKFMLHNKEVSNEKF